VCRLHAVLCELVPGGVSKRITAAHAARVLDQVTPSGAVMQARCELAADFLQDLRRIDDQMQQVKKKLAAAVQASGTTLTEVFGSSVRRSSRWRSTWRAAWHRSLPAVRLWCCTPAGSTPAGTCSLTLGKACRRYTTICSHHSDNTSS
jgi:hypothetical protein